MSRPSFAAVTALLLGSLLSGCAVLGDPAGDPTGEQRLQRLQFIQAQMSSYLAARTATSAPSAGAGYVATPLPYGAGAPAAQRTCRSRETVCGSNNPRCVAADAGLPYCR